MRASCKRHILLLKLLLLSRRIIHDQIRLKIPKFIFEEKRSDDITKVKFENIYGCHFSIFIEKDDANSVEKETKEDFKTPKVLLRYSLHLLES